METVENRAAGAAAQRDGRGRWVPGQSGNPAGKPPGTRNHATILKERLRDEDAGAAVQVIIDKAVSGNLAAARFVLDRIDPKPRGRPIAFAVDDNTDVRQLLDAALRAVAGGEISIEEGLALLRFVKERRDALAGIAAAVPPARVQPTAEPAAAPAPPPLAAARAPASDDGLSPEFRLNLQARGGRPGHLKPTLLSTTALARPPTPSAAAPPAR